MNIKLLIILTLTFVAIIFSNLLLAQNKIWEEKEVALEMMQGEWHQLQDSLNFIVIENNTEFIFYGINDLEPDINYFILTKEPSDEFEAKLCGNCMFMVSISKETGFTTQVVVRIYEDMLSFESVGLPNSGVDYIRID